MADRDVTLKIGTRQQGDLGKPMKQLAKDARDAGRAVADTEAKLKRAEATGRGQGGAGGGLGGGRAGGAFGQVAGKFGFGGIGGGGAAGAVVAALAAINKLVDVLQHGGPFGQGAFNEGKFSGQGLEDSFFHKAGELPLMGHLFKLSTQYQKLEEKIHRVREAEEALQRTEQRLATERPFVARRVQLADELVRSQARLRYGASSAGAQFALGTAGQYAAERQQLAGLPFGRDRATYQADVAAGVGFEVRLRQQQVEQTRQLKLLDSDRARTAALIADRELKLAEARRQAEGSARNLSSMGRGAPGSFDESQRQERRLQHERALVEVQEAERQLQEALDRQRQESVARGDTLLEQQRERLGLMEQERDRLTGIVRQERERLQAGREQFGLQNVQARYTLLQLSRKIGAGGELSEREIGYIQQHGGELFRPALADLGRRRAGPEYDEIARNLGADRRLAGAEQARVALENKISVEIKMNEAAVADQLQKKVIPEIHRAMMEMERAFATALEKLKIEQANQRRPVAQG